MGRQRLYPATITLILHKPSLIPHIPSEAASGYNEGKQTAAFAADHSYANEGGFNP